LYTINQHVQSFPLPKLRFGFYQVCNIGKINPYNQHSCQAKYFQQIISEFVKSDLSYLLFITYTGCRISASLSYFTVRGEGKMERAWGEQDAL
jgi:hypothetical protein